MPDPLVHSLWPIAGTVAAGFFGGAAAWFATNFVGRPDRALVGAAQAGAGGVPFPRKYGPAPRRGGAAAESERRAAAHRGAARRHPRDELARDIVAAAAAGLRPPRRDRES